MRKSGRRERKLEEREKVGRWVRGLKKLDRCFNLSRLKQLDPTVEMGSYISRVLIYLGVLTGSLPYIYIYIYIYISI